jgi:hypothetical protein
VFLAEYGLTVLLVNIVFGREKFQRPSHFHSRVEVDCRSLAATVRLRFRIRVSGFFRATLTEAPGSEACRNARHRARARMNCSKTSRSASSQSFKAVPCRHPPADQSSCASRSICPWALRCSSTVKTILSANMECSRRSHNASAGRVISCALTLPLTFFSP